MSLATHAAAAADVLKFPMVAEVVDEAVCLVIKTVALVVVMSVTKQFQPVVAAGSPITPLVAEPPVPTFIRKAAVPLWTVTEGLVPKPDDMVGTVADIKRPTVCSPASLSEASEAPAAPVPIPRSPAEILPIQVSLLPAVSGLPPFQ